MNSLWQTPVVVLAVLAWLAAPPKSLGEAAQRETIRRQATPKSQALLTNFGQPRAVIPPAVVTLPPDPPDPDAPPVTEPPVTVPPTAGTPPAAAPTQPKQDEAWWRDRIAKARETLARDETVAAALETRVNTLRRDSVRVDDPARRSKLRQDLQKAVDEQALLRKKVEDGQKAIAAIQDEARRMSVPPGWVR